MTDRHGATVEMDRTIRSWIAQANGPGLIVLAHLIAQDPAGEASERILSICGRLEDSNTGELIRRFVTQVRGAADGAVAG